jgi:hypothetical protein
MTINHREFRELFITKQIQLLIPSREKLSNMIPVG